MSDPQHLMAGNDRLTDARLKYRMALAPFATSINSAGKTARGAGFIESVISQVAEGI